MNLFSEDDYKKILKERLARGPRGNSRKLADYLRVNPSLVSQVISGQKDFTEEQILAVAEFLGLARLESRYLLTLVQVARAGSVALRELHLETLESIRKQARDLSKVMTTTKSLTDSEKAKFYSSWIFSAVHLCTTLDKPIKFNDICRKFHLSASDAQQILSFLIEIGLIREQNGIYKPGPINTHLEKSSPFVANMHRTWRLKAMQIADTLGDEELMYSCNFSVSRKDFARIRAEFFRSIQEFLKTAQASPSEEIAQFNLDLFWIRG